MEKKTARLYFVDAMRAWAILMMLQGHFIDGLLDPVFRDNSNITFTVWKYFRGITAPVFFTVSGFIFTYLLIKVPQRGWQNPRVSKGIKRGLQLLFIGYLLRANLFGILKGQVYKTFFLVDVLHCIGLSLLGIIGIYLLAHRTKKTLLPVMLLGVTLFLFLFEPIYSQWTFEFLPQALANFLTRDNGSVFTIIPWFGYTTFGAFLSVVFTRYREHRFLYPYAISLCLLTGTALIFYSSWIFMQLTYLTGIPLFRAIADNNYLFIRLGDVFVVFAMFMLFRRMMVNATLLKIGQSTLSIYIIHFIILYGSFTGLGLYRIFHHGLNPTAAISGALIFMFICSYTALRYEKNKATIKAGLAFTVKTMNKHLISAYSITQRLAKVYVLKLLRSVRLLKS